MTRTMTTTARSELDRLITEVGLAAAAAQRRVAGVLFTYRCTISCRHCLFGCGGDRPDVVMSPRQLADALAMLHETGRVVHVAGGEPMMYWEALSEGIRLAYREDNAPHFIETNCSFAVDEAVVAERLEFLAAHGVRGLLASADPFHQEWVPPERFLMVRRYARVLFGEKNYWGSRADDEAIFKLREIAGDPERLREYTRAHPPVMVGTAQRELARYLDSFAPDDPSLPRIGWRRAVQSSNCLEQFRADTMWELHVDPYGNIQTNCGMVLGQIDRTRPVEVLARGPEHANRFVAVVCREGPLGLAQLARSEYGFEWPPRVSQGCELCYLARRHLRRFHPEVFGPAEVYN